MRNFAWRRLPVFLTLLVVLAGCSFPFGLPRPTQTPTAAPSPTLTSLPPSPSPLPPTPSPVPPPASPTPSTALTPSPSPTLFPTSAVLAEAGTPLPEELESITSDNAAFVSALATWREDTVTDLTWAPDSRTLAVARYSGVSLYDAYTRAQLRTLDTLEGVISIAYSPRNDFLATGNRFGSEGEGYAGNVDLWRVAEWTPLGVFYQDTRAVSKVAFSPTGNAFAAAFTSQDYLQNTVVVWDTTTWGITRTLITGTVLDIAFSPDARLVATTPDRYAVRIWQLRDGRLLHRLYSSFSGAVNSLAFSPDGASLATGHYDGVIQIWDVGKGQVLQKFQANGVVESLAFSPDGSVLASGQSYTDNAVLLWEAATGQLLHTLSGHEHAVDVLAFSPDGAMLASGSYDGSLRLWGVRP